MQTPEAVATPVGFATALLGLNLYAWQERVLWDLDEPGAVALRACNGSGKTSFVGAAAVLWHASVFPGSLAICTSGVWRQVRGQLFPAIRKHGAKFAGWTFNDADVAAANGSRIFGFSTDEAGKFEGWHNPHLLILADEAKSIPDTIFEAIERCQPERLLMMSSPGCQSGFFFDAFSRRKRFFKTHAVAAEQCPHISPEWIAETIEKYGAGHPLVRSMVFGEFMEDATESAVIPSGLLERCLAEPPAFQDDGTRQAFLDFAAGGDENVMSIRRGNAVEIVAAWRERDTMKAVGKFIMLFREHRLEPNQIAGDEGGLGGPMIDALKEAGWPIRRFNFGGPARDTSYNNAGAEIWFSGRTAIERREIILPANDRELFAQLTTRRGWPNSRGKLTLEPKAEMFARGLHSPDRADAVLGAWHKLRSPRILVA